MISRLTGSWANEMSKAVSVKRHAPRKFDPAWRLRVTAQSFEPAATVREVAERHGVRSNLLSYWRKKYGARVGGGVRRELKVPRRARFVPVSVAAANEIEGAGIEIALVDGTRVRGFGGVDVTTLAQVLTLLRR